MKKKRIISLFLTVSLLFCLSVQATAAKADVVSAVSSHGLHAQNPLAGSQQLLDTAQAVVAYELNTDTLLYTWNADQHINPTGMVKLLSALIVLEEGNLDDVATVRRSTLDTISWGAVSAGLKAGEKVVLRDLLLSVMVASANDAAAVMAAHVAGSQQAFVERMNERAKELGCTNSNFTNVHGLMDENQYSTARDLAIIVEAALENEQFSEMFSLDNFTMAATNLSAERYFITTNYMMSDEYTPQYFDYRVTGGKPAAAASTDRSMICTAEFGNSRYLFVVMSAESQVSGNQVTYFGNFAETKKLMNFAFNGYTVRQVLDKNQTMYQYAVKNGPNDVMLSPQNDVFVLLPADYDKDAVLYHNLVDAAVLRAPIAQGSTLGVVQIEYQGFLLANCGLIAMNEVSGSMQAVQPADRLPPADVYTEDTFSGILLWVGVGMAAVVVLLCVILLCAKGVQGLRIRRQQMVRARKRKRSW